MRIAVASSGLGHIARGIETCALLLAESLNNEAKYTPGLSITLFHATRPIQPISLPNAVALPGFKRGTWANRWMTCLCARLGGWRYGFGSSYETEQTTFAPGLIRALRVGRYDIVHLQDPGLAWLLEKARRRGRHPAQVILAHGTEESPEFLKRFPFLQELTPVRADRSRSSISPGTHLWMIPNFVDTHRFVLAKSEASRRDLRARLNLAPETRIIGCVAALKATHKRLDYLIDEFTSWLSTVPNSAYYALVLLGATTSETPVLRDQIERSPARAQIRMLADLPYGEMPNYYVGFDLHVLCSLKEMFGISP